MLASQPPKIWQEALLKYINDYDKVVLCGKCQNNRCSENAIVISGYYDYRWAILESPDYRYFRMDCPKCKTEKSIHVYNSMNDFRVNNPY